MMLGAVVAVGAIAALYGCATDAEEGTGGEEAAAEKETAAAETDAFASQTVDIGIVVSDVDKAAEFYTGALGFTEIEGFDVPAEMGKKAGLSAGHAFSVRVFVLGEAPTATKVKLMEFPDAESAKADHATIHSTLGLSYLTLHITDTTAAMERLTAAGVKPVAEGPYELPEGFPKGVYLTIVRDPDGNLIELVGPKK
jgi:catechol 2,3-dioxygenase-like lactoylglutathione lyase family enzyme